MPQWEMVLRLVLAAALGSLIGLERERLGWAAGLRTHMLVCVGSCLMMIVSAYGFSTALGPHVVLDPSRVAAQVVSGIGFLGAGSIIIRKEAVKGLTTAAGVWAVAGVGLATGGGLYVAGVATTVIILLILAGLKPFEDRFQKNRRDARILVTARRGSLSIDRLEAALGGPARVRQVVIDRDDGGEEETAVVLARISPGFSHLVADKLRAMPGVAVVRIAP